MTNTNIKIGVPPQTETANEADIIKLICEGVAEKEVVINNVKYDISLLTAEESSDFAKETGHSLAEISTDMKLIDIIKLPLIKRVVKKISTQKGIITDKEKIGNILSKIPVAVLDKLFMEYMQLTANVMNMFATDEKKTQ